MNIEYKKDTGFLGQEGARLYYETAGTGYPLLLIHAGIADSRMWDEQFEFFAQQYRVIRFDLRGNGKSEIPAGPFGYHNDVKDLLIHLGIEKAHVVAGSFGGSVALDFALAYPEMVTSLALVAPSVGGMAANADEEPFEEEEGRLLEQGDLAGAVELNLRTWVDGPYRTEEQVDAKVRALVGEMQLQAFQAVVPEGATLVKLEPAAFERLGEIRIPTLLMVGDKDTAGRVASTNKLAEMIEGAQVVTIADGGHMVSMERVEEFNRVVGEFLARV